MCVYFLQAWIFALLPLFVVANIKIPIFGNAPSLPFGRIQALAISSFDFWESAKVLGDKVKVYTDEKLLEASIEIPLAKKKIYEFKESMAQMVNTSQKLRDDIERIMHDGTTTMEQISAQLSVELQLIQAKFKEEFSVPLPQDEDARYADRIKMLSWLMPKIENAFVNVHRLEGVPEANARTRFQEIRPHAEHVILVTGKLVDRHPILVETLIFSGAVLLIPEAWLLRPFLGLFGFGPYGPVKGSLAAWSQRRFWGAAVAEGSWFARLQSAGMKYIPPGTGKKIIGSIGLGLGIIGTMFRC